jgi:hypothetical protein
MEMTKQQAQTVARLAEVFCTNGLTLDVFRVQDAPQAEGWLRIHIVPRDYWMAQDGVVRHISERTTAFPGGFRKVSPSQH